MWFLRVYVNGFSFFVYDFFFSNRFSWKYPTLKFNIWQSNQNRVFNINCICTNVFVCLETMMKHIVWAKRYGSCVWTTFTKIEWLIWGNFEFYACSVDSMIMMHFTYVTFWLNVWLWLYLHTGLVVIQHVFITVFVTTEEKNKKQIFFTTKHETWALDSND